MVDLESSVTLFIDTFGAPPWHDRWPSRERAHNYLSDITNMPGFKGYVAEAEGSIAAVCLGWVLRWWSGDLYNIQEFWVDRARQRQGIGGRLMRYVEEELREQGVRSMGLFTHGRYPAAAFYKRQGFQQDPETVFLFKAL